MYCVIIMLSSVKSVIEEIMNVANAAVHCEQFSYLPYYDMTKGT